jgi:hypothetical protein
MLAQQHGFEATAFCPLQEWKAKGQATEPGIGKK